SRAEAGYPLGVVKGETYATATVRLGPGDAILLFTDGVTEAMNTAGDQFGPEGVRRAVGEDAAPAGPLTPLHLVRRVAEAVRRYGRGRPPSDDVALVCFGRRSPEIE